MTATLAVLATVVLVLAALALSLAPTVTHMLERIALVAR